MGMPEFTMRQLLEAGVHFGHRTRRWNPDMAPYIFGIRNKIHIIDLQQTVPLLAAAMQAVRSVVAGGGRVLFVGTKRQASHGIREAAKRCAQNYVDHRWLGGMLTNWKTISNSIQRLKELDEMLVEENLENLGLTKKETLQLTRERDKLERALGGIKEMGAPPNILVVIDTNKEAIAVREANKLSIPVVAVIDSNSDPAGIEFPIPGNDDSLRAIELYCDLLSGAVLDGLEEEARSKGVDLGAAEEAPAEHLPPEDKAGTKAEPAAKDEAKPETKADEAKQAAKADKADPEAKADKAEPEAKADKADPEAKADEAEPEAKADEAKPEAKADEAKPEAKADEAKPDAKADEDSKTEDKTEAAGDDKEEAKSDGTAKTDTDDAKA